ncbi:TetR/AcrR family transcriptional regulator [Sulfurovum riftiae]|uniref:HTH tetR-type domain-containing protein n=1 Tax=Sulfurovum riftiae TaxID=1630136 RepID=A0A151CGX0_9BACT|nr:TetR/AcrR family transcriptional regulator [Sulfurovum riftiae]KYJ86747.1 hypothetical protein AS592_07930 [Sulfurovum riftiae]
MAIIVNKKEKRRNIALACQELLLEHGIDNITISQIAKTAGVGKGTVYEYFENKEDIVFEIITTFVVEYEKRFEEISTSDLATREKLFRFFNLLFENETARRHLVIYKEFLAISMVHEIPEMLRFSEEIQAKFVKFLHQILQEGIGRGVLQEGIEDYTHTMMLFGTGLVVDSRLGIYEIGKEIECFLDMIFMFKQGGAS